MRANGATFGTATFAGPSVRHRQGDLCYSNAMSDEHKRPPQEYRNGFPLLPRRGQRITTEDVIRMQREMEDDDAERACDPEGWHARNPA